MFKDKVKGRVKKRKFFHAPFLHLGKLGYFKQKA